MRDALGGIESVLVLGGASDLALATIDELAKERTRTVVLAGRDPAKLEAAAERVRRAGATDVEVIAFDATAIDDHERVIADVGVTQSTQPFALVSVIVALVVVLLLGGRPILAERRPTTTPQPRDHQEDPS